MKRRVLATGFLWKIPLVVRPWVWLTPRYTAIPGSGKQDNQLRHNV